MYNKDDGESQSDKEGTKKTAPGRLKIVAKRVDLKNKSPTLVKSFYINPLLNIK